MNEEYLNEAAGRDWCENVLDRDLKPITKQAFKRGAQWHESLPLADRLSESEKEKIRNEYRKAHSEAFAETTCLDRQYARGRYQVLSEIFGKNLFTPTEQ